MENNTLFKDIEKLIETIDGEDFSEVGMLVNSLQSLNAVANEGSIRGLSDAIYSIQTALSSLHSMTKSAPIQKNIENIQGNMNKMFSSIESMSESARATAMKQYAHSANQIAGNYQKRAAESGKLFTQVSPDTANSKWLGNMRRNNLEAYNSVTNGILLMQEKAWNDSMDAVKRASSQPFTSQSLKNGINERTKTIASRRREYEKLIGEYTAQNAFGSDSKNIGANLLKQLNQIQGGNSRMLSTTDPFAGLSDQIFSSLTNNFKSNVGSKSSGGQSTAYTNTSDARKAIENMVGAIGGDLKNFMGYDYFKQRTNTNKGIGKAQDTFDTMQGELVNAMNMALTNGIGSFLQTTNGGKAFKLGFFNQSDASKIFKTTKSGARTADWSQMASFDIGIPNKLGNMLLNGMSVADYMVGDLDKNGVVSYKTLSQTMMENISNMMQDSAVINSLRSGDARKAQYLINQKMADILPQAPRTGSYKDPASAAMDEILSDSKSGSTIEQSAMRASQMVNSRIYEQAYNKYFKQHGAYDSRKAAQMHDYTYAKYLDKLQGGNTNSSVFDNNKDYQWLTDGSKIIDNIAGQMATISSNIGIGGLKEPTYNAGRFMGLDANVFAPFHALNVGSNRALSQAMNYTHRTNRAKTIQSNDLKLNRTLLDSAIGKQLGVNYGDAEHLQYTLGRTDDYAIYDATNAYYDQLLTSGDAGKKQIDKLAQRYLSKNAIKGKSASEIVNMLKQSPMASVAEGGAIVSDTVMASLASKRIAESHKVTADDLKQLGINAPAQGQPLKNFNTTDIKSMVGFNGIDLSSGLHISANDIIKGVTDIGDGFYQMDIDKQLPANAVQKVLTSNGDRLMARSIDDHMFDFISKKIGADGAHLLTERKNYADTRKTAGAIQGRYEYLAQEYLRQGGNMEELQKAISNTPVLKDFLSYADGGFHTKYSNQSAVKNFYQDHVDGKTFKNTEDVAKYLNDFNNTGGAFHTLAKSLFSGDNLKRVLNENMESAALRMSNEYSYFDPVGSVSKTSAQYDSRYKITPQQRDAMLRTQGLYGFMSSGGTNILNRVFEQYMSHDAGTLSALEAEKRSLMNVRETSQIGDVAPNRSGQQIRIVDKPVDSLAANEIALSQLGTDNVYRPDGKIATADWNASVLGAVATKARELGGNVSGAYIDIENSGGAVTFDGKSYKSLGVPIMPTTDGDYTTPKPFEGEYNNLIKHLQSRSELSQGDPSRAYQDYAIGNAARNAYNDVFNATDNKGGYIRDQLENVRATNAIALKAQATNIAQQDAGEKKIRNQYAEKLQDSLVMNPEDIKGMLRTGKGGDRLSNIEKLSWMYEDLLGTDTKTYKRVSTELKKIQSGKTVDDSGKIAKGLESSLINGIMKAISLESGSGALSGLLHRYPLINGHDIKHLGIRASEAVGRGRMVTGKGVERAINLDYDGDTGYASMALFGAKNKEEFMQANKEFKEIQNMQSQVNSLIGDMAIRKYQKDNTDSKPSMSEAMNKLYSAEGQKNTLLADLKAKGNFGKVGLLSNYSRDMRTTLFNNSFDETGANPLNAAQSMIARAFFESFEQNAISSKKIDSKIRESTKGQSPDNQRAYLENALSGILDYANNIGKADSNGVTRTWDGLIKLGQQSGIFGDDGKALISDRVSHQAVGNIQVMAERRFGKGTQAYSNFMKSLGFSDNLIGQEYGADRPYEGALSAEQVLKSLTSLEKISMDKTGKSLSDNRWAARASYYGYTKLNNDAIDSIENSRMNRYQKAINAQSTMDRGATLDEAQRAGTQITGAGSEVVTLLANIAQTLGTLAGVTKNADVATQSYAQSLIQNVNAMNAGMSAAKGYAQVFNGEVAYAIGARQNANYDQNHKYDITSPHTSDNGVLAYDYQGQTAQYSVSQLAKILTGGGAYKDAETMKTLGSAIDGVRGTGQTLTAEDFGLNGASGSQRWDSLRQGYMKTELGTYQHANTQYVNEVNQALNDFIKLGGFAGNSGLYNQILGHVDAAKSMGLSNATEIRNNGAFAELFNTLSSLNMSELGVNNPFQALLGQLSESAGIFKDAESRYTSTAKALGLGDHISSDQAYVDTATSNMFKTIQKLAGPNGYVSSEVAQGIRLGDTTIAGAIDSLIYNPDTKTMTGLDNKNTSFTSNENVLQQMMYEGMLRMTQNKVRSGVNDFVTQNASNTDWVQNGKMTRAGYMEMAAQAHANQTDLMLGQASPVRTANLLEGFNEAQSVYTKLGTIAENGSTEVRSIIEAGVSKVISLMQMAAKGMQLSPEEIRGLQGYVSKIADIGSKQDGKDGVKRNNYGLQVAPTVATAEEKAAMARGIKGVRAADAASINMLRAQRAREDAYRTGNAQQITAAEQQIEGIRREAEIANQYKPRFTMYDKSGKVVSATGADGKPVNIETLKGQVEKGILTTYNQDTQEWESTNLQRAQALKYQQQLNLQQAKYTQAVGKTSGQVKTLSSLIGSVVGGMKQTISYLMRTSLVYAGIGKIKQAFSSLIQTVYSLNKAYVDLRIASGQTDSEMKNSLKTYNQMAREMGKTTQEVANAANDWLRAGYNAEESAKLIKNSMQLSTVGMIDSAKATEYLISTMKGWKIGVNDMEGIVDKLTELDRNAAITAGDLAESMSRANVSAQLAGSSIDKYMSYLTTVSDVSQLAPESVGTAFKTLYSRYGNVKAGKFVAGAGDEDNSEDFEALNDIEKVLQKIGISMRTSTAEFRSFDEVIAEIANKWAVLSDVEQNAISTAFAGTRQREVFNVLMENFDEVSKYERIADQSAGTTAQKMDIYSDSLEASKNRITAATEELTQKLFGGDMEEVLKTWNNQLAYIIKNADTLLTAFIGLTVVIKGLVGGTMFGGLAKLMQSILVSGASFRNTMATAGTNLYNSKILGAPFRALGTVTTPIGNGATWLGNKIKDSSLGRAVTDKTKSVSNWFGQTSVGKAFSEVNTKTTNQIDNVNANKLYSAAYKAGIQGNMDAVSADKSANFLKSLNKQELAYLNSMSPEARQKFINSNIAETTDPRVQSENELMTSNKSLQSSIDAAKGSVDRAITAITGDTDADQNGNKGQQNNQNGQNNPQGNKSVPINNNDNQQASAEKKTLKLRKENIKTLERGTRLQTQNANAIQYNTAATNKNTGAENAETGANVQATQSEIEESIANKMNAYGMTRKDMANTGVMLNNKGVQGAVKNSTFAGLGAGLAGVGSMGAMIGGTMLGSAASQNSGRSWTQWTGMGAGMLLSSGISMGWNPAGWAMMLGGVLLGVVTAVAGFNKTSEKIQEEAEEARSNISDATNELKEMATEIEDMKKQSSSFNKLAAGVDPTTGENVTLSDEEFSQYQDQLKEIINARDELYASYNKEGDLIAMRNGEIVKSNELMEEAIKLAQEERRLKASENVSSQEYIDDIVDSLYGYADQQEYTVGKADRVKIGGVAANAYDTYLSKLDQNPPQDAVKGTLNTNAIIGGSADGVFGGSGFGSAPKGTEFNVVIDKNTAKNNGYDVSKLDTTKKATIKFEEDTQLTYSYLKGLAEQYYSTTQEQEAFLKQYFNEDWNFVPVGTTGKSLTFDGYGNVVDSAGQVLKDENGNNITKTNLTQYGLDIDPVKQSEIDRFNQINQLIADYQADTSKEKNIGELIAALKELGVTAEEMADIFNGLTESEAAAALVDTDSLNEYSVSLQQQHDAQLQAGTALTKYLNEVVDSVSGVADLDDSMQSILYDMTTGLAWDIEGWSKGEIEDKYKEYQAKVSSIAHALVNNPNLQYKLQAYDVNESTQGNWSDSVIRGGTTKFGTAEYHLEAYKELLGGVENGKVTDPVMKQMYKNAGFEFIGDTVVTKQEYIADKLKNSGKNDLLGYTLSDGHSIWRNFTESEMSTIYENYDLIASDSEVQGKTKQAKSDAIKRRVQEIMMVSYSAQQLFGVLQSDIDNLVKKNGDVWVGTLSEGVNKYNEKLAATSEAYHKLLEMAKRLGIESVEEFAKMSKSLKLDEFGYSTLSMQETEENFNQLESIRNQLDNEGTISAEEWDFLAQNFSDVVTKYSVDDMISAIDDALQAKEFQIEAEIKGTLAEDSDLFKQFSSFFITDDTKNHNWAKVLSGTTNIKQIQQLQKGLDLVQGNSTEEKKQEEKKQIAKVFNIDPTEDGWEDRLNNTLKTNYNATYSQFVGGLKALNSDNIDIMGYWNEYINPIVELQKEIQKTAENNEAFANDLNDIKTDFDNGSISIDKYISRLKSLQNDSRASKEQLEELAETLEDATFSKISEEFKEGALSVQEFTSELSKLSKKNVVGSEDWETFAQAAIDANDQQKKINDSQISMLGMQTNEDFTTKRTLQQQNIDISLQKLAQIQAMGELEHGEDYNPENDSAFVEARNELYTEIKEYSETFTEQKSYLEDQMSKGNINGQAYIDSLSDMIATGELTTEQLMEFSEAIEDATLSVLEASFERGSKIDADGKTVDSNYTGQEYRKDLLEELSRQARGSDDEKTILDAYFNSFDAEISRNESQIELIQEGYYDTTKYSNKYDAEKDVNKVNATLAYEKMESLKAAGYSEDSEEYKAAEAEAFKWMQASSDVDMQRAADFEEDYQNGSIGLEDFVHGLESISDSTDLTAEDLEELSEKLEDASYELSKLKFETGQITGDKYREDLLAKIQSNAENSEDEIKYKQAYLDSFGTEISANQHSIELAQQGYYDTEKYSNKYSAQKDLNRSNAALAYEQMLSAKQLFGEDSEQFRSAQAEAVKWMEANSDVDMQKASDLREDYENGSIGLEEFVNSLEDISKSTDLTAEDLEELSEQIEDTKLELAKIKFEEGQVSGDDYRSEIMKKIQGNVEGSEDRRSAISQYISSYSSEVQKSEQQASLLADNDFSGKAKFVQQDIDTLTESLAFMEAAGLKNSEEYLKTVSQVVNKKKEQLDLEKQIYEYEIKNSEEVLDAYSNILSYGIDELQNCQQDINDLYDDEISKLQDINDQKQRSIELTKLQQELENAKKERVRVYQAGVGFTYQENKGAVKEANQKLDDFNQSQKIEDLRHAQEAQNKLIEDEIKRLTDIQDYISSIKQTADVTASLMDLKKHGIVPQDATISDAINQITQSAVNGASGKVESLGTQFGNFATSYTTNSALLAQYTDELEAKLSKISDLYMTYASDAAMVNDFVTQLNTKISTTGNPVKDTKDLVSNINQQLITFLGGENSPTVTTIDSHISEVSKAVNNKTIPDPTPDTGDIKTKLTQFIGESTASGIANKVITDLATAINNKKLIDPNDPTNPVNTINANVSSIKDRLNKLMGNQEFDSYLTSFKNKFEGVKVEVKNNNTSTLNSNVAAMKETLKTLSDRFTQLTLGQFIGQHGRMARSNTSYSQGNTWDLMSEGRILYDANGQSYIKIGDYWYKGVSNGKSGNAWRVTVGANAMGMKHEDFMIAWYSGLGGYASGIENGPVTYTGLAMLHGSPSSPEYVLNSDQAGTLLKNLATMTMSPYEAPVVDSYENQTQVVTYQFNGDMNLPNVQRPDQFFDELLKQANVQFPTIKRNYY